MADLCPTFNREEDRRFEPTEVTNYHINVRNVQPRSFKLSWNIPEINVGSNRVKEYLGWQVTFRKFGEKSESEVFLLTHGGKDVKKKTGTDRGHYTVNNLEPDTSYLVCINTLSQVEVNNIIETQNDIPKEPTTSTTPETSIDNDSNDNFETEKLSNIRIPPEFLQKEWEEFWRKIYENETSTRSAVEKESFPSTTRAVPTNYVYSNTGELIPISFLPPSLANPTRNEESRIFNVNNDENLSEFDSNSSPVFRPPLPFGPVNGRPVNGPVNGRPENVGLPFIGRRKRSVPLAHDGQYF